MTDRTPYIAEAETLIAALARHGIEGDVAVLIAEAVAYPSVTMGVLAMRLEDPTAAVAFADELLREVTR